MNVREKLQKELSERNDCTVELDGEWLTVRNSERQGYGLSFWEPEDEWVVFYEGWHEHFDNAEDALRCFWDGIHGENRIKVFTRGGKAYRWTLQFKRDGRWISDGTTVTASRIWRKRTIEYLGNPWRPDS